MSRRRVKSMFSLSGVAFRSSAISGRGVFARRRFDPGETVVAFAPKQRKVHADDPEATIASKNKFTLLSEGRMVIIPDTSVPGGWLCNHGCKPNAAIFSDGEGRIECTEPIAPGEEVNVFYGWVTQNDPARDRCFCGSPRCRGFINFDVSDEDARNVELVEGALIATNDDLARRLAEYAEYLHSIGQEQVQTTIAHTLASMKGASTTPSPPR